jgi:hypothetical protein
MTAILVHGQPGAPAVREAPLAERWWMLRDPVGGAATRRELRASQG